MSEETLLEFPCEFPVKAFIAEHPEPSRVVLNIVHEHVEEKHVVSVRENASKNGKYIAVTVTITAHSKNQLDNIYQGLTSSDLVVMAL